MTQGWIKLHRQVRDHWLWQVPERLRAWIDLLFMANFEDREELAGGEVVVVPRGSIWTSECKIAGRWGRSRRWVRILLDLLQQAEMITRSGSKPGPEGGTIITVCNYETYQSGETPKTETGARGGPEVGPIYKEERIEEVPQEDPELLPEEFTPEAEEFYEACLAIYRVRRERVGDDMALPPNPKLKSTFDKHTRTRWPRIINWKELIASFRVYWCHPGKHDKAAIFDYWRRFATFADREAGDDRKGSRPSGRLDPPATLTKQRYIDEYEDKAGGVP